jgi:hypothetical protein
MEKEKASGTVRAKEDDVTDTGDRTGGEGTATTPTGQLDVPQPLGVRSATSKVVHEDGWNEETHGQHPSDRPPTDF